MCCSRLLEAWKPHLVSRQDPITTVCIANPLGGRPTILLRRVRGWHRKWKRHLIMGMLSQIRIEDKKAS